MSNIRLLPGQSERVETGAVQFGEDWPGLFIRGDNAIHYRMCLQTALRMIDKAPKDSLFDAIAIVGLKGLVDLMSEPIVHPHKEELLCNLDGLQDLT